MRAIRFNVCNAHISVYNRLYRSCEVPDTIYVSILIVRIKGCFSR
nr:MAG TPA: hypothetical protein [Caudoviricetes sp.]